jgi:hypothetical protein
MCIICLSNERISLSIFVLAHPHAAHSSILSITFFHFVRRVLILSKYQRGSNMVSFLGYFNDFFVTLQILSNMFEINVYSIIDSKVFGVTFGVNFLSIVE